VKQELQGSALKSLREKRKVIFLIIKMEIYSVSGIKGIEDYCDVVRNLHIQTDKLRVSDDGDKSTRRMRLNFSYRNGVMIFLSEDPISLQLKEMFSEKGLVLKTL